MHMYFLYIRMREDVNIYVCEYVNLFIQECNAYICLYGRGRGATLRVRVSVYASAVYTL